MQDKAEVLQEQHTQEAEVETLKRQMVKQKEALERRIIQLESARTHKDSSSNKQQNSLAAKGPLRNVSATAPSSPTAPSPVSGAKERSSRAGASAAATTATSPETVHEARVRNEEKMGVAKASKAEAQEEQVHEAKLRDEEKAISHDEVVHRV
jgi:hypothetical protein